MAGKHAKSRFESKRDKVKETDRVNKAEENNKFKDIENDSTESIKPKKKNDGSTYTIPYRNRRRVEDTTISSDNEVETTNATYNNMIVEPIPYKDRNKEVESKTKKNKVVKEKKKKKVKIVLLILVILIVGIIAGAYAYLNSKIGKMNYIAIDESNIGINDGISLDNYRNIALLGVDTTSDDYGVGNRTDCIIIASINKKTSEVKLFSVYRDTYVEIPDIGLDKVNHAYANGAAELSLKTLNSNLDLNISEFIVVNFDSVRDMVDSLGGVEIDIQKDELQSLNSLIGDNARVLKTGNAPKVSSSGKQTLIGIQALAYSRIRDTAGEDYRRTERMRNVLMAMFEKAKSKDVFELNNILNQILPEVTTSLTTGEIISLIPNMAKFKIIESMGWPYQTKPYDIYGPWYGVPVTLESNVKQLHKEVFGQENYEPTEKVKEISKKIVNKTGYKEM